MRSFRDAKLMAKTLREALASRQIDLSHSETLEIVARQFGLADWNTVAARLSEHRDEPAPAWGDASSVELQPGIPILRIFDVEKAREFYLDFLGFTMDWDHRYGPNLPIYMQVSRSGLTLHLSEHHGDASPGSTVFVRMKGVGALRAELLGKAYADSKPGIQDDAPGGRLLEVPDPSATASASARRGTGRRSGRHQAEMLGKRPKIPIRVQQGVAVLDAESGDDQICRLAHGHTELPEPAIVAGSRTRDLRIEHLHEWKAAHSHVDGRGMRVIARALQQLEQDQIAHQKIGRLDQRIEPGNGRTLLPPEMSDPD
jgi:catechol 2,3-dioxygenase-like lactoylglutathione lyase family enzyme